MNILVRSKKTIPQVVTQLWYNVGAKDELDNERGLAHLIEHMIFKGTKKLSETDIDLITAKMGGYANAFTSNDYTCFYFKFPSNVWHESLKILSDCMKNVRFDEQMLKSELMAVLQELKLYRDEYQESLVEKMLPSIFVGHPYAHPVVGYKSDLVSVNREDLLAFYKKHYHPANAVLVVTGDVDKKDVFESAEKSFGKFVSPKDYSKKKFSFLDDVFNSAIKLPRHVDNPWSLYAYPIPGMSEGKSYLFKMASYLIANGRSSRLYEKLVNETKLATQVGAFVYEIFEKSLFFIYVQPTSIAASARIEEIIEEELAKICDGQIENWEFLSAKKRAEMSFYSKLENAGQQAELIGSFFLATGNPQYFEHFIKSVGKAKRHDIQKIVEEFLIPARQHAGYLLPAEKHEEDLWRKVQNRSDKADFEMVKSLQRTSKVELGKAVIKIKEKPLPDYVFRVPDSFVLDNGIEVVFLNRPEIPKISLFLGMKADYLYEPDELGGMSTFLSRMLLEGTKKFSARELNKLLETHGMLLYCASGILSMETLSKDFDKGLEILYEILTNPLFSKDSVEKVRQRILMELNEFWSTPLLFVDSLARNVIYEGHPYSKNRLGHKECVEKFSRNQISDFYKEYLSPEGAILVIVGDLGKYDDESKLRRLLGKNLGNWKGKKIPELVFPEISYKKRKIVRHKINRDQAVLALAAPSISRVDPDYDFMALLDFIFTGGGISSSSRLYRLREQSGMFYTIGGSLVHGAGRAPGMMLIKTLLSLDKVEIAEKLIKKEMKILQEKGVSRVELKFATRALISASVRAFETNGYVAKTFLFLRRCGINLDLFDKRRSLLSIIRIGAINKVASRYCRENFLSTIKVGRM
jgi:zinc protease